MYIFRLNQLALAILVAMPLSACSGVEQKRLEYRQSQSTAPLKMPVGLQVPQSKDALPLHQVNPDAVEVDTKPPVNLPQELQITPKRPDSNTDLTDEN